MGYTTTFDGVFTFSASLPAAVIVRFQALEGVGPGDVPGAAGCPDSYNQWELSTDALTLAWDGNEKFYHYVAWLQFLVDTVLLPAGIHLQGAVTYDGEERGDFGVLVMCDDTVKKIKHQLER